MTYRPKRIATPATIYAAAAGLCEAIGTSTRINDAERDRWYNATTKALAQLMDGCRIERTGDDFLFPSRTRAGLGHRVNGTCDCEACAEQGWPCWHRAAKKIVLIIEAAERDEMQPPPAPEAKLYHCPRCAAPLFFREDGNEIYICSNPRCVFQIAAELMESIDVPAKAGRR